MYTCMNCGDERRGKPAATSKGGEPRCGDCAPETVSVKIPVYSKTTGKVIERAEFSARTLPKLRKIAVSWVEENDYGASDVGSEWPVTGDKKAVKMSYNGKYWDKDGNEL